MYELILPYFAIRHHAKKAARATFHLVIVAWACSKAIIYDTYFYNTCSSRAAFFHSVIARRGWGAGCDTTSNNPQPPPYKVTLQQQKCKLPPVLFIMKKGVNV
jgi:hypothetical protein